RNFLSSQLVSWCVENVELYDDDEDNPIFWQVRLPEGIQTRVETLKRFNFLIQIMSPRMRVVAYRGKEIVAKLFEVLASDPSLLPDDFREYYSLCPKSDEERIICDYISCMTDRYAVELYGKITSENNKTFFSPH
ncbi:MAG: dehydrogenase, partial [Bacteroidota bacterium]